MSWIDEYSSSALPAGKIAASRAEVLDEERVAGEHGVADAVRGARRRVPRRSDDADVERAGAELVAVTDEVVELAAVGCQRRAECVGPLEDVLDLGDPRADDELRPACDAKVVGAGDVIGVHVRLEDVVDAEAVLRGEGVDLRERSRGRFSGDGVEVEDRIDDDRVAAGLVEDDVGERGRRRVEELLNLHAWLRRNPSMNATSFSTALIVSAL